MLLMDDETGMSCNSCLYLDSKFHNKFPYLDEERQGIKVSCLFTFLKNNISCLFTGFVFRGQMFMKGDAVMLLPKSFDLPIRQRKGFRKGRKIDNAELKDFTEYWRKPKEGMKNQLFVYIYESVIRSVCLQENHSKATRKK